ncbi:ribonuclease P protein component [Brevibacterium limosum]|uniref:ribonuclease P protein component n=1 Tax=Brevibacterium limosum TaxID=2697565 RepID=UPI0014227F73|nr:ribonuclease P protein component [Brevibacterium limosum]
MLDAAHRIRSGEDFRRIFRAGVRVRSEHLMAHSLRDTDDTHAARVGFIVSKAVGNAVVRNRTKRRLREIMRARLGDLRAGDMFVIRALPHAGQADFAVLSAEVDELLAKAEKKLERRGRRA